jgi:hypothetical protein
MRKNRDRLSLIAATLKVADTAANKTKIMYMLNLSFKRACLFRNWSKVVFILILPFQTVPGFHSDYMPRKVTLT